MSVADGNTTAKEAARALDALAALSVELSCHCDRPPDELVLDAGKLKETCSAIDEAVASLRRVLMLAERRDGPLVSAPRDPGKAGA
jgi:hypothetical protein